MIRKRQTGFTLIELIMVIVILGILAATALPKFADLSTNAESAAVSGARGAVAAAMAISHAQSLIEGEASDASTSITVQGSDIDMVYGYPNVNATEGTRDIILMAGLSANDFTLADTTAGSVLTVTKGSCSFTYTEATSATVPAVLSAVTGTGC